MRFAQFSGPLAAASPIVTHPPSSVTATDNATIRFSFCFTAHPRVKDFPPHA
jgi:hypothetical protein